MVLVLSPPYFLVIACIDLSHFTCMCLGNTIPSLVPEIFSFLFCWSPLNSLRPTYFYLLVYLCRYFLCVLLPTRAFPASRIIKILNMPVFSKLALFDPTTCSVFLSWITWVLFFFNSGCETFFPQFILLSSRVRCHITPPPPTVRRMGLQRIIFRIKMLMHTKITQTAYAHRINVDLPPV